MIIELPQLAWYEGPKRLKIDLPDEWDIEVCNIAGYNRQPLNAEQIKHVVSNPIGMPSLKEMARGKKEVAILFDDLTRATRPYLVLPYILKELSEAGIPNHNIRFISALGAHAPLNRIDLVKKLGEDVVARYQVYNHNVFDNCTYVGTTSSGNKIYVNSELMQCDLKITIGSIMPHPFAVFSGGGKIILPGVSSLDTIMFNHNMALHPEDKKWEINSRRLDMEEAAAFVKVDMAIDCIVNMWGETVSIYAGSPAAVRDAAITEAKKHYLAKAAAEKDIVLINTFIKVSEAAVVLRTGFSSVKHSGGDVVLFANAPAGQVGHYLIGVWGSNDVNRKHKLPVDVDIPPNINHLLRYNQYPDIPSMLRFKPVAKHLNQNKWEDILSILKKLHGKNTKVVVYPSADIQYVPL